MSANMTKSGPYKALFFVVLDRLAVAAARQEQTHIFETSQATQQGSLPQVECVVRAKIPAPFGVGMYLHLYRNSEDSKEHLLSPLAETSAPLFRVHSECFTGETAWSNRCDCGGQLDAEARLICQSPSPNEIIVYLRHEGEANLQLSHLADARTYGIATAILCDLGLGGDRGIRLLTNSPEKVAGIRGPMNQIKV
ncbi:putative GTP cyclohydrolase-2 [Cladobotryum mycophilum]|uniref:GTP cyclohydrolase-2 n=1 Tax=Cladobotryum mycophilum TaxID=491253 RepID=A0ABR0SI37_9HYPO